MAEDAKNINNNGVNSASKDDFIPIIGSGTIGSYAAYLLAKQGFNVALYEDHDKIGIPCHCTGIVTAGLLDIIKLKDELIVNRLNKVKVVAPNNSYTILKSTDIVLDRVGFDVFLAEKAVDAGAKLEYNHKFVGFDIKKDKKIELKFKNKQEIKTVNCTKVIAADGPNSALYSLVNPNLKREPWIGVQVVIKGEFDKEMYEAYLGSEFAPGFFAWVVPESEKTAIIGLATKEKTNFYFEKFMKQRCGEDWKARVQSYRGGLIPLYNKKVLCEKDGIFLVGDAGLHCKATTGGGIIPGMKAAHALANSFKAGKEDKKENKNDYGSLWRKYTGKDLWIHLKIRQIMNKFSDEDYNYLVALMNKKKPRNLMERSDREYPSKFMLKMLAAEPRFLYFMKHLF